ncbi:MAG: MerR family transcriptional regulator [Anaerolineales bacterium]|nr:MerR family transcriptional regulator [Anaerolineales bacterium]
MLKIGDFSRLAQVTVRALRLYDELDLLKPARIDPATDYRYYTLEQLPRLNRILALKESGFALDEIRAVLEGGLSPDQLWELLAVKQAEIEREVQTAQSRLARVEARLRQIRQEGALPAYEVVVKRVEPVVVASRRVVPALADMPTYRERQYREIYDWLAANALEPLEPEMAIYHSAGYVEQDIDMELAVPAPRAALRRPAPAAAHMTVRELPGVETMACVVHQGDIWDVGQPITALYTWLSQHGLTSAGPYRELHLYWRELTAAPEALCDITLEMQVPAAALA